LDPKNQKIKKKKIKKNFGINLFFQHKTKDIKIFKIF